MGGPNDGKGVEGWTVKIVIYLRQTDAIFEVNVDLAKCQFNISMYGEKRLVVKRRTTEVYSEIIQFKPAIALRPPKSFIFNNAKTGGKIATKGIMLVLSEADPRSTPSSPAFEELRLPYDGSTAVSLPSNLPDAVITVTPDFPLV